MGTFNKNQYSSAPNFAAQSICDCRNCGPICRFELQPASEVVRQFIESKSAGQASMLLKSNLAVSRR